jgi:hypothetical protein
VFVRLTVDNNSFWVLQLTRVFTFRIRDSIRVFSRRQASRNKRVGAVDVIDGVGRSQQEQQQQQTFDGQTPPPLRKIGVQQANKLGKVIPLFEWKWLVVSQSNKGCNGTVPSQGNRGRQQQGCVVGSVPLSKPFETFSRLSKACQRYKAASVVQRGSSPAAKASRSSRRIVPSSFVGERADRLGQKIKGASPFQQQVLSKALRHLQKIKTR